MYLQARLGCVGLLVRFHLLLAALAGHYESVVFDNGEHSSAQACMAATSRWGSAGAYGVVTMPFSVREGTCKSHELRCLGSTLSVALPGINVFLDGFIPTDACMQHVADRCRQWISARASMRATTCAEIQENLRFREALENVAVEVCFQPCVTRRFL